MIARAHAHVVTRIAGGSALETDGHRLTVANELRGREVRALHVLRDAGHERPASGREQIREPHPGRDLHAPRVADRAEHRRAVPARRLHDHVHAHDAVEDLERRLDLRLRLRQREPADVDVAHERRVEEPPLVHQ